jgi:hypothetical protein
MKTLIANFKIETEEELFNVDLIDVIIKRWTLPEERLIEEVKYTSRSYKIDTGNENHNMKVIDQIKRDCELYLNINIEDLIIY